MRSQRLHQRRNLEDGELQSLVAGTFFLAFIRYCLFVSDSLISSATLKFGAKVPDDHRVKSIAIEIAGKKEVFITKKDVATWSI